MGVALQHAYDLWSDNFSDLNLTGNVFVDSINAVFGTNALFDIRKNAANKINPLAQLAALGRTVIECAMRALVMSGAASLGGGLVNLLGPHLTGTVALAISSFVFGITMSSLSIGFVLY
jgi:hypothetical protein